MTVIVAKYVNPAKPDKKFGSIVDAGGAKFMLPVGMQDAFAAGQTYDVPTSQKKWGDSVVTVIEGRPGAAGSTNPATPPPAANPAPPAAPRPAYNGNGNGGNVSKDVQIATIALMKSFIESGSFGLTDLPALEAACIPTARSIVKRTADGT